MESVKLVVQRRHRAGKGVARQLRRAGQLPAVVYGNGATVSIAVVEKDLLAIRQSESGENTILDVVIDDETSENCQAILREVQVHPISRVLLHADFYRVDMAKAITVSVPLIFNNEPHSLLQSANATLTYLWREIEVECLPGDIPDEIAVDLGHIHPGATVKAGALLLPPGVTLVTDAEEVLVSAHIESTAASGPAEASA
jgi:large subunit ribosomal protein L25